MAQLGVQPPFGGLTIRIDVAGREKVEAPVHCTATSIRVELSRLEKSRNCLEIMGEHKSKTVLESILIKRLYKKKGRRSRSWKGMMMRTGAAKAGGELVKALDAAEIVVGRLK